MAYPSDVNRRAIESVHGTGHLFSGGQQDLNPLFNRRGSAGLPLGINQLYVSTGCAWVPTIQKGHSLGFGMTGGGKGTALAIPAALTWVGGLIAIDPKAELGWATAERRRQMGQRVIFIDPWNEINRQHASKVGAFEKVHTFNPLADLDPESPDFATEIDALAAAIVVVLPDITDPHWPESAGQLAGGLMAAVVEAAPGVADIGHVRELLTASDERLLAAIQDIVATRPDGLAAKRLARFAKDSREVASIRSTSITQTAIFDTVQLLTSMETGPDSFSMKQLVEASGPDNRPGEQSTTIYVVLPPALLETHGRWLRLVLTLALREIAKAPAALPYPILMLVDEMGTIGPLKMLESAFGLMARTGAGLRIWGFLQDLGQLQRDYRAWETFIGNCSAIQLLSTNDNTTAEYFSKRLGTMTIAHQAENIGASDSYQPGGWNSGNSVSYSTQYYSRPVLYPHELMSLPDDEILVMFKGGHNHLLKKMHYYEQPGWVGLYRQPPGLPMPTFSDLPRIEPPPPAPVKKR